MTDMAVLHDRDAQQRLDEDGFVLLEGVAAADVDALRDIFAKTHDHRAGPSPSVPARPWSTDPAPGQEFVTDLEAPFELRDRLEALLEPIWARHIDDLFIDHRPLVSTFLMKWPGGMGHLPLHQDPSFVDERVSRAVTLWIAVDDAAPGLGNGPLHIVPGSHLVADEYRGTRTTSTFLAHLEQLWTMTVPIAVRSGDAIVIDGRLIHGSPPNTTDALRLAVCTPVAPRSTPLIHAVGLDDGRVAILDVDDDFYRRTSPGRLYADPPALPPTAEIRPLAPRPFPPLEPVG